MRKSNRMLLGLLGGARNYAAESLLIFAAMTTPPTTARKILIDNLVISLKASGAWTVLDCLWVLAAADSQAALLDWKTPSTNALVATDSPTFTADRGYAGNGSTARLVGPNLTTLGRQYVQDNAHMGVFVNTNVADDNAQIGNANAFIRVRTSGNTNQCRLNDATSSTAFTSVTEGRGHSVVTRSAAGSYTPYKNGVAGTAISVASTVVTNNVMVVCSSNATASGTAIVSAAHIGASLSAGQAASFYSALLVYMQSVGAA